MVAGLSGHDCERARATDDLGNFVVFELKLGRGPDAALGQVLRYGVFRVR